MKILSQKMRSRNKVKTGKIQDCFVKDGLVRWELSSKFIRQGAGIRMSALKNV